MLIPKGSDNFGFDLISFPFHDIARYGFCSEGGSREQDVHPCNDHLRIGADLIVADLPFSSAMTKALWGATTTVAAIHPINRAALSDLDKLDS